jgi:predicted acylesterase/phospholipase RssA
VNGRIGIVLSGWAPAMTLMSGAMLGFMDAGIEFKVISTAGVGALIGLLSLAPKHGTPKEALAELPNMFVSDILYAALPINFKMFHKFGPFAKPMHDLRNRVPRIKLDPKAASPFGRLLNDWVDLAFCAMTPSTFEPKSAGLMSPGPEIDDLVNFTALRGAARRFYLNAFNLDERTLEIFDNATTNADAYRAAEALPLLFAPQRMANGDLYTTGATHDPTGLQAIWLKHREDLDAVIMLDPMARAIWREPINIHDAFQLMLMNPIIALQVLISTLYAKTECLAENIRQQRPQVTLPKLYYVPFDIDREYYPSMLKWSHSNAVILEKIGRDAALAFAAASRAGNRQAFDDRYRYCNYVARQPRLNDFARPFARLFDQIREARDG